MSYLHVRMPTEREIERRHKVKLSPEVYSAMKYDIEEHFNEDAIWDEIRFHVENMDAGFVDFHKMPENAKTQCGICFRGIEELLHCDLAPDHAGVHSACGISEVCAPPRL